MYVPLVALTEAVQMHHYHNKFNLGLEGSRYNARQKK